LQHRARFNDEHVCFFGVSTDPDDEAQQRVRQLVPGFRLFWDFDGAVSRLYGAATQAADGSAIYRAHTLVLDRRLRVLAVFPFEGPPEQHVPRLLEVLDQLPPLDGDSPEVVHAPVLIVPRVFEPELCRTLMRYYDERGGQESGFMRDVAGQTRAIHDYGTKRRRDQEISDEPLRRGCMARVHDRLVPEVYKAFQFRATRIERYIVACYDAETGGYFRAHRDNTTKATAHRKFACSLNLNTGAYEGGGVRFPEFSQEAYSPPAGGAVVFSCSLLHEATPVTKGKRYVFLPFLYDEEGAKIRDRNRQFVSQGEPVRSAPAPAGGPPTGA
jgi:predicted 2-oxoglutarate/Fe(II)-dependent dioxygenase YbiX